MSAGPNAHCCSLAYCYICPSFDYDQSLLLPLSLCWPPCCSSELPGSCPTLCIPRFYHISSYMHDVLKWVTYRILLSCLSTVWCCLLGLALAYLCSPTLSTRGSCCLHSAELGLLYVPLARTSTWESRAFSVVDPSIWNGLPLALLSLPRTTLIVRWFNLVPLGLGVPLNSVFVCCFCPLKRHYTNSHNELMNL